MQRIKMLVTCCVCLLACGAAEGESLSLVATTSDLADIARAVGGSDVKVHGLLNGDTDPHFAEPRPSMVRELNRADALLLVGMELEVGWLPVLVQQARNAAVRPGSPGYLDASAAIEPLGVPTGPIDRSHGDVHASGNPHYLLDPVSGMRVAIWLAGRLGELRPDAAKRFEDRAAAFSREIGRRVAGDRLAEAYDVEKLARLQEHGRLIGFLESRGQKDWLGGAWKQLGRGPVKVVGDHDQWPYLARRLGFEVVEHLEPRPGVPPTARHLAMVVKRMRQERIDLLVASTIFNPRHVDFVASKAPARVVRFALQSGAVESVDGYIDLVEYNLASFEAAIEAAH